MKKVLWLICFMFLWYGCGEDISKISSKESKIKDCQLYEVGPEYKYTGRMISPSLHPDVPLWGRATGTLISVNENYGCILTVGHALINEDNSTDDPPSPPERDQIAMLMDLNGQSTTEYQIYPGVAKRIIPNFWLFYYDIGILKVAMPNNTIDKNDLPILAPRPVGKVPVALISEGGRQTAHRVKAYAIGEYFENYSFYNNLINLWFASFGSSEDTCDVETGDSGSAWYSEIDNKKIFSVTSVGGYWDFDTGKVQRIFIGQDLTTSMGWITSTVNELGCN